MSIVRKMVSSVSERLILYGGELSPLLAACALYIIMRIVQLGQAYGDKQAQS